MANKVHISTAMSSYAANDHAWTEPIMYVICTDDFKHMQVKFDGSIYMVKFLGSV